MISAEELDIFATQGAVTIDTPLTQNEIAAAAKAIDALLPFKEAEPGQEQRFRFGATCNFYEPALIDLIQHPFFEAVAKEVLRADAIRFFQTAILATYPQPESEFRYDQHTDIQYSLEDWDQTPRRVVCSYFLWLTDVDERRSPMMHRPGSHRLVAAARSADPALKDTMPGVQGIKMENLPPEYAAPQPVLARAGQVTVLTTSMVHGGSTNVDTLPRKVLVMTYTAAGVEIGLPDNQAATKREYDARLKEILRPERAHLVDLK
ncbi:MAG: phytanoyl-CoA dioxygenase family protein [Candidatus Latescibacterota bacterium]|nr:phytanoyl-CoA dioxygenase family protein [Candidatus Latescibacterota bacterium]